MKPCRYVVITPVKDEGKYIASTLASVIAQTVRPAQWIIVDDGSTDDTSVIIREHSNGLEWIKLVINRSDSVRNTGVAEVLAFNIGLQHVDTTDYDFIVKLDGDLRFEPNYFEKILGRLTRDKDIGIASGVYLENEGDIWKIVEMPDYHAAGASKIVRKACFDQIEGFITEAGWDTVDEIRARYRGWRTAHFKDIPFFHLKSEGMGMGYKKTNLMHGEIYHRVGGGKLFFIFKVLDRILFGKPLVRAGAYMLLGYLQSLISAKPLLLNKEEARIYRYLLNERVRKRVRHFGFQTKAA